MGRDPLGRGVALGVLTAVGLVALLLRLGVLSEPFGDAAVGALLLLLLAFYPFRTLLREGSSRPQFFSTVGLAVAWLAISWSLLFLAVWVGRRVYAGPLAQDQARVAVQLGAEGTLYDLAVEGTFIPSAVHGSRSAGCLLRLERDGRPLKEFAEQFSERWGQRKVSRRGVVGVHELNSRALERFSSPGPGTYELVAVRVDEPLLPSLHVDIYEDVYPERLAWLAGGLLLVGALVVELRHAGKETPLVVATAAAVAFVLTLRYLVTPPFGLETLIGAGLLAGLVGAVGGTVLRHGAGWALGRWWGARRRPAGLP